MVPTHWAMEVFVCPPGQPAPEPLFFAKPADFEAWLEKRHDSAEVQWVGFHKKATARPSITWGESVDEALCYGWIDGLRKTLDEDSYTIRFTPRKPKSAWSARNIERVAALKQAGRMRPAGLAAFAHHRDNPKSGYRASNFPKELPEAMLAEIRANPRAWAFYKAQSTGYRRLSTRWITGAKREETRARRLATLIGDAAEGLKIKQLRED